MNPERALKENWPPQRVTVSCDECESILFDSRTNNPSMNGPSYLRSLIITYARKHENRTGHDSINVNIKKKPTQVKKIDATITVNG